MSATWSRVNRIDELAVKCVTTSAHDRFWSKVQSAPAMDCWLWLAGSDRWGYGRFFVRKESGRVVTISAHRWSFLMLRGNIDGLLLDHLCRTPGCVNPWHLEPVTNAVNLSRQVAMNSRKAACKRGHAFTPENTGLRTDGRRRYCRECARMAYQARRAA